MERGRDIDSIDARLIIVLVLPFFPSPPPQAIYLLERKCQRWHLKPPRGPPRATKVRLRRKKVILRNDSRHSPRGSGKRNVVRISEERR